MNTTPHRDHSGESFGTLYVVAFSHRGPGRGKFHYVIRCHCGGEFVARIDQVKSCRTQSCGCSLKSRPPAHLTHGMRHTPEYQSWVGMKQRCTNPKSPHFHKYGGRGITVCDRWLHSFANFIADMGRKPASDHTLDRIDNSGPYAPENCRWASPKQQANNRRLPRKSRTGRALRP